MAVDLTTSYLGMKLKNPLVVAACPLTADVESLQQLEQCGAAAAVLPSLFAEQIEHDEAQEAGLYEFQSESFAESTSYFPHASAVAHRSGTLPGTHPADATLRAAIPIIASLNGSSEGSWTRYARLIQDAGADALELNVYFVPTDAEDSSEAIEQRYVDLVAAVRRVDHDSAGREDRPVLQQSAAPGRPTGRRRSPGTGAVQPLPRSRISTRNLCRSRPNLVLSDRHELRLSLRWIATLRDQVSISLAATSGVHFSEDVVKALLAGADVAMMAAALLRYGPSWLESMLDRDRTRWLENQEYTGVAQLKGSMSMRNYCRSECLSIGRTTPRH